MPPKISNTTHRIRIHGFLMNRKLGATDDVMQIELDLRSQTQTPRRGELVKMGVVKDSGRRAPTRTGCMAIIWVACKPERPVRKKKK